MWKSISVFLKKGRKKMISDEGSIDGYFPAAYSGSPSSFSISLTNILLHSNDISHTLSLLGSDDIVFRVVAANEIRCLINESQLYRRDFSVAIPPLVGMLGLCYSTEANEAALAALVILVDQDETNKLKLIEDGVLELILGRFLFSEYIGLREQAVLGLNIMSEKPSMSLTITDLGAIPLLLDIMERDSHAVLALCNLSLNHPHPNVALHQILETEEGIPRLVRVLMSCNKSSKVAEKCTLLIGGLMGCEEGRAALACVEGGIPAVVLVLKAGNDRGQEYAVGALLKLCRSNRANYRFPILGEAGVITELVWLTKYGMPKSRPKAETVLRLLLRELDSLQSENTTIDDQWENDRRRKGKHFLEYL